MWKKKHFKDNKNIRKKLWLQFIIFFTYGTLSPLCVRASFAISVYKTVGRLATHGKFKSESSCFLSYKLLFQKKDSVSIACDCIDKSKDLACSFAEQKGFFLKLQIFKNFQMSFNIFSTQPWDRRKYFKNPFLIIIMFYK